MDLQNLMPQQAQPINRVTNGQLTTELAELTEELLEGGSVLPASSDSRNCAYSGYCSYDGDDAE